MTVVFSYVYGIDLSLSTDRHEPSLRLVSEVFQRAYMCIYTQDFHRLAVG